MIALCLLLTTALAAVPPPLASSPEEAPARAASPVGWDSLPSWSVRRLRLGLGLSYQHRALEAPGGNALGLGASAAWESRHLELALSVYAHGGFAAQDLQSRHTGPATTYLRASLRVAPFSGWLRVMLEAGGQVGYERAWAWCAPTAPGEDQCALVPDRASWAGVAGVVVVMRASRAHLTLGLDALLNGPGTPDVCSSSACAPAAIGSGRLGLQAWLEAGYGGHSW
ncbi:MAG: hypothetical protein HY901_38215 [Deltaproteobacteria bacterium]|nr:hypothetical protein [Deltaproteobacteria bacterium]